MHLILVALLSCALGAQDPHPHQNGQGHSQHGNGNGYGHGGHPQPEDPPGGAQPVPEPGTLILLGSGLVLLAASRRGRKERT